MRENGFSALRAELRTLLDGAECVRPPALRRSRKADILYFTDLPRCAGPEACASFAERAGQAGWEVFPEEGGIGLRPGPALLPGDWRDALPPGEEAACLRSLLERHPELSFSRDGIIRLLKALEEGGKETEAACRGLHREAARFLRERRMSEIRFRTAPGGKSAGGKPAEEEEEGQSCFFSTSATRNF